MRITVIIINSNYADLVEQAIVSSLNQTCNPRVVIVDDGSVDNSHDVYKKFSDRITVVNNPVPTNPSTARNLGVQSGWDDTDLFAFLDADDVYARPDSLSLMTEPFEVSDKVGLCYADCDLDDRNNQCYYRLYKEPFSIERFFSVDQIGGNFVLSKKALAVAGKYNEDMKLAENYELAKRVSDKFVPIHIPQSLIVIRRTDRSLTVTVGEAEWQYYWQRAKARANVK